MNKGLYFSSRSKVLLTIVNCLIFLLGTSMVSSADITLVFTSNSDTDTESHGSVHSDCGTLVMNSAAVKEGNHSPAKTTGDQEVVGIREPLGRICSYIPRLPPIPVSGPQSMCLAIL